MRHRSRVAAVAGGVAALMLAAPGARASGPGGLPAYHRHLDFNLTGPSAFATAVGGFANPAVYALVPGAEIEAYWAAPKDSPVSGLNRWGAFTGLRQLGFGFVHERAAVGGGVESVTDYRLALSGGTRSHSFGVSLGWSRGARDAFGRTTLMQLGLVERIAGRFSLGVAGAFSTEKSEQTGLLDAAWRPLGDQRLTVFGDVEFRNGVSANDVPWSAGAMLEVPAGVKIVGRYYDTDAFSFALAYTLGGGVRGGRMRGTVAPRYDKDATYTGINWGVRFGYPEHNALTDEILRDRHYVRMELLGPVKHTRFRYFDRGMTFSRILQTLEGARTDPRVGGVALSLSGTRISPGNAWELREKLAELQRDGKRVVVFIDEAGMTLYHLASVADRVVMAPEGLLLLPGYAMGRTYTKRLAEKLGIGVEEWRFKDYKSALESRVRRDMSPEDREQRQALVDGYYRMMRSDVAASRNVEHSEVDRWIDELTILSPRTALDAGVVDVIERWERINEVVADLEGSYKSFIGPDDVARFAYPSTRWGDPPRIAVVYAIGGTSMDSGINARRIERQFRHLRGDRRVKAVVMRVNSPGGRPLAANAVSEALRLCAEKKPVVISQGDVAASGGYWISMYGDEIVAQPTTITGSIGYIGGWAWDDGIGEKLGLDSDFVKAGEHADVFVSLRVPLLPVGLPHRALTDEERGRVLAEMEKAYEAFVAKVAEGRGMTPKAVEAIAKGRVWTGAQGLENGLVDRIGGLETALAAARERAGIARHQEVEVVEYGVVRGLFDAERLLPDLISWPQGGREGRETPADLDFLFDYPAFYVRQILENNGRPMCLLAPEYLPASRERRE